LQAELEKVATAAWCGYSEYRKSPHTRKAGPEFADPDYDLSVDWLAARQAIREAQVRHDASGARRRILLISASSRSEHTCPGEVSKTYRLAQIAAEIFTTAGDADVEFLELSRLTSEYGRNIHPCKACFSTAAPLCHWPCSCYPNYALGQAQDWMNDIYPMWVAAHGVMIITPVNWYQVTSPLKLMIDRLVCGRLFSVIVHGDVEGAQDVRRNLSDWLRALGLISAGPEAEFDRYIGYWQPYATSHDDLDRDQAVQEEVRNAARALLEAMGAQHDGRLIAAGADLKAPRDK
jgi:multimeric flavodoxin WrbA